MIIEDLQRRCIELSGLDREQYHHFWTKWIAAVDREKDSGFAFTGDFFDNSTLDLDPALRLILFAASTGGDMYPVRTSRRKRDWRYVYEYHEVFILLPTGELERTGLATTDDKRWALAIRDQVALWLGRINQVYGEATPLQLAYDHLTSRMLAVRLGNPVAWNQQDVGMLQIVLDVLENSTGHTEVEEVKA